MPRTSDKADLILDYVNQFVQENGFAPSVREIGAAAGLKSTASVSYHLQRLQEQGLLLAPSEKGRKRAVVTAQRMGQIPVIGVVTKCDHEDARPDLAEMRLLLCGCEKIFFTSAKTGQGIDQILSFLA